MTIEDCNSYSAFAVGSAASPAVGGNALQVVAVDATATAAEPTLPQTDTVSEPATSAAGGPAAILLVAAVVGFLGSLAVSMRRVRQD